jgi:hypothetical protein
VDRRVPESWAKGSTQAPAFERPSRGRTASPPAPFELAAARLTLFRCRLFRKHDRPAELFLHSAELQQLH